MLIDSHAVIRYCRASAGRSGVNVVFEDKNQPRHDGSTIYLPKITSETTEEDLKQRMASIDHEVAHDLHTSFKILNEEKPTGLLMFTWNFLEDSRVNTIEARQYKGFRNNWDFCTSSLIKEILSKSKKPSFFNEFCTSLIVWESNINKNLFPLCEAEASLYFIHKDIKDVLYDCTSDLIACHNELDKEKGTTLTFVLAKKIIEALGKSIEKDSEEKKTASSSSSTDTIEEGDKKPTPGVGSPSTGEAGGEKEEKVKERKTKDIEIEEKDIEDKLLSKPREMGCGIDIKIKESPEYTWGASDPTDFIVVDYFNKKCVDSRYLCSPSASFLYGYNKIGALPKEENFAQTVRRLIQIRAKVQTQYGVKRGKLDQSRIARVSLSNCGEYSSRIFKNKIENKTLDAAVSVLIDMSGSMGGHKVYYALSSAILVNEVCSILNIPLEIVGFTDSGSSPVMFLYKSFSNPKVSSESLKESVASSSYFMTGNPDGDSIIWTHDRLSSRKERKKLLIVMSDGQPAASKPSGGLAKYTRKTITEIENNKKVLVYGLGLCSDAVVHFYKNNVVVWKPQEIPSSLLTLLEQGIINV